MRVAAAAPDELALQVLKDNVAADALVGRTIMYKWHEAGWCVGRITGRNADKRHKVNAQVMNFYVFYESDGLIGKHALSLARYHHEGTGVAEYQDWVLLEAEC